MSVRIFLCIAVCALSACSQRKSTAELAFEMANSVAVLPDLIESAKDAQSADLAVVEIEKLSDEVRVIYQQVEDGSTLSYEEYQKVKKKMMAMNGEAKFLLKNLHGKPEVLTKLAEPIAELGKELEHAEKLMKVE